jgi:hypothetical protein
MQAYCMPGFLHDAWPMQWSPSEHLLATVMVAAVCCQHCAVSCPQPHADAGVLVPMQIHVFGFEKLAPIRIGRTEVRYRYACSVAARAAAAAAGQRCQQASILQLVTRPARLSCQPGSDSQHVTCPCLEDHSPWGDPMQALCQECKHTMGAACMGKGCFFGRCMMLSASCRPHDAPNSSVVGRSHPSDSQSAACNALAAGWLSVSQQTQSSSTSWTTGQRRAAGSGLR